MIKRTRICENTGGGEGIDEAGADCSWIANPRVNLTSMIQTEMRELRERSSLPIGCQLRGMPEGKLKFSRKDTEREKESEKEGEGGFNIRNCVSRYWRDENEERIR